MGTTPEQAAQDLEFVLALIHGLKPGDPMPPEVSEQEEEKEIASSPWMGSGGSPTVLLRLVLLLLLLILLHITLHTPPPSLSPVTRATHT
jgi:hypothetical protein